MKTYALPGSQRRIVLPIIVALGTTLAFQPASGQFTLPAPQAGTSGYAGGGVPTAGYTLVDLGANTVAFDVSDGGLIAGVVMIGGTTRVWDKTGAVVWSGATTAYLATGINNKGETVSELHTQLENYLHKRRWNDNGTVGQNLTNSTVELPPVAFSPGGWRQNTGSSGAVRDLGWGIRGAGYWKSTNNSHPYPVFWPDSADTLLEFMMLPFGIGQNDTSHKGPVRANEQGWIAGGTYKSTTTTAPWTASQRVKDSPAVWIPGAKLEHPTGPTPLPDDQYLNGYNLVFLPLTGAAPADTANVRTAPLGISGVTGGDTAWAVGFTCNGAIAPASAYARRGAKWYTTDGGINWTHTSAPDWNNSGAWSASANRGNGFYDVNNSGVMVGWGELDERDHGTAEEYILRQFSTIPFDVNDRAFIMDANGYYTLNNTMLDPVPGTTYTFHNAIAIANDGTIVCNTRVGTAWHAVVLVPNGLGSGVPNLQVVTPASKSVNFGSVEVGQTSASVTIWVQNDGQTVGTVNPVLFAGDTGEFTVTGGSQKIYPYSSATAWTVTFHPSTAGPFSVSVGFEAVEDQTFADVATLSGTGTPPGGGDPDMGMIDDRGTFLASGGTYDFGLIIKSGPRQAILTITNDAAAAGSLNLTGSPDLVAKTGGDPEITVTVQPPLSSLAAEDITDLTIEFAPLHTTGSASATFEIPSNDPATPYTFTVTGEASPGTLVRVR